MNHTELADQLRDPEHYWRKRYEAEVAKNKALEASVTRCANELHGLVSRYTYAQGENADRLVYLLWEDAYKLGDKLLEALEILDD